MRRHMKLGQPHNFPREQPQSHQHSAPGFDPAPIQRRDGGLRRGFVHRGQRDQSAQRQRRFIGGLGRGTPRASGTARGT